MDDDNVGYGKPPKHTRFKKGQSGNPRGRPKRNQCRDSSSLMNEILDEPAIINVDGRPVKSTKRKALLRMVLKQATEGKPGPLKAVLELMNSDNDVELFEPDDTDKQLLRDFVERQQGSVSRDE